MNMKYTILAGMLAAASLSGCKKELTTEPGLTVPPGSINEVEPNDSSPQSVGTLSGSDINVAGSATNAGDVDRFIVTITAATNLFASVTFSSAADLDLAVQDGSGINLAFRDTGAQPERCTLTARPAGTHIIEVTSKTSTATSYVLTIGSR